MILIKPHTQCPNAVAISPDGKLLATVGKDRRVIVWKTPDVPADRRLWEADADRFSGSHLEFGPDGRWLYTCGDEGVLRVWAAKSGKLAKELDPPGFIRPYAPPASALTVSRDGRHVAWGGGYMWSRSRIVVADATEWRMRWLPGHDTAIGIFAATPDGLLSGSADQEIRFWDWETGRRYRSLALRGFVRGLAVTESGDRLAASCGKEILLWELSRSRRGSRLAPGRRSVLRGHTAHVACLAFSPDGKTLASTASDGTLRLWDVATGVPGRAFAPRVGRLHWLAFAPDGLTLAFTARNGHVGLLDLGD